MTTRKYSSRSQQTTLSSPITATATTMTVVNGASIMGGKTLTGTQTYTVVIDPDTALEEIVDVTVYSSGNTLTITRGVDGPTPGTGSAHSAGAVIRHMAIGRDYQEANDHIEATTGHGATGAVVGTTNTQTLTNKTLTSPTITGTGAIAGTFTGNLTGNVTGSSGSTTGNAATATALATGRTFQILGDVEASSQTFDGTGNINLTTSIASGVIVNADVNSSAQIAYSKINATNSIVDADINASAAIAWTKIAPSSTVSATELGYLDGVTSAVQTQLDAKLGTSTAASTYAPLASPALTGVPTAPTATAGTNTTQVATTAYVGTAISNLVAGAPTTLDTLDEIAAALADTANFSDTVVLKTGSTMSGALAMGTNKITGLGNPTNAQDAATKYYIDNVILAPSNLTGPITSVGNATSIASQTGTGTKFVVDNTPTLITPVLGVATATSINGTTIPTSKTLVATDSTAYVVPSQTGNSGKYLTTDGTTSSWGTVNGYSAPTLGSTSIASGSTVSNVAGLTINSTTIPTSKTLVVTTDKLSVLAATTSAEFAGIISDEIGTGNVILSDLATSAQTASYTLVLADRGKLVEMSNASANNLTVPLNSSVAYPTGTQINILQTGAGQTTVVATGGVTINATPGLKLRAQWSSATLIKRATDTWVLVGDLSA